MFKKILDDYEKIDFVFSKGKANVYGADLFMKYLLPLPKKDESSINGHYLILDSRYFNPKRWNWTVSHYRDKNTFGIQYFSSSWSSKKEYPIKTIFYKYLCSLFGIKNVDRLKVLLSKK